MKKARKVRILGQDMKFFVDKGAYDEMDDYSFWRVILYGNKGERWYWNTDQKGLITASYVKKLFTERKFIKVK